MPPRSTLILLIAALPLVLATAIPVVKANDAFGLPLEFIKEVLASYTSDHDGQIVPIAGDNTSDRSLEKRLQPTNPACNAGDAWIARFCMSDIGPREGHDRCQRPDGTLYWAGGICPEVT